MSDQEIGDDRDQTVRAWLTEQGGSYDSRRDRWFWPLRSGSRLEWQRGMLWVGNPRHEYAVLETSVTARRRLLELLGLLQIDLTPDGQRKAR